MINIPLHTAINLDCDLQTQKSNKQLIKASHPGQIEESYHVSYVLPIRQRHNIISVRQQTASAAA